MRLGFFMRESLRSMRRNAVPSFAALATVLVTVLVLGVFIPVAQVTSGAANDVRQRVLVGVYLKDGSSAADISRVSELLRRRTPHVKTVQFISKKKAFADQSKADPAAYALVDSNPLPDSFRVTPDKPENVNQLRQALMSGSAPIDSAIATVNNRRDDAQKILTATSLVKATMAILAVLLVIASVLLISNTIRLSLFARRREVEVMKLVGATDWFIRWPFVIEGILLGAFGGILAIAMLVLAKIAVVDSLVSEFSVIGRPNTINFPALTIVLMACAVAVSAAGSGLSLRRFLRV
ncbi:MAG: cell division transport system permease protein [Solirubrobacteraceae bacterium]|nr:cell division transport system permease protein [Solirubrobacteraceae bacterium]MEA2300167.1 cell division transport system permease protein [Solirubrobacteraceae bacterium]